MILVYLDFRGGRERESTTYCGKQQANLGFPSASQTFNEKSFSRRVFLVKKGKTSQKLERNSFVYFSFDEENCREPAKQQRNGEKQNET